METGILLLQVGVAALIVWGAFLCLARRDRRLRSDRRSAGSARGGRRRADAVALAEGNPRAPEMPADAEGRRAA